MSKSSKHTLETGGEKPKGQEKELDNPIFCEKCRFIFQGENEFENHKCMKKSASVVETTNNVTMHTRRGRQTANKEQRDISSSTRAKHMKFAEDAVTDDAAQPAEQTERVLAGGEVLIQEEHKGNVKETQIQQIITKVPRVHPIIQEMMDETNLQTTTDDDIDPEIEENDVTSNEMDQKLKKNSQTQKIWQHTKTIDLKSDLYRNRWTKIDGKAAICNNCRKVIKTRSSLQYHLGVAQCGPQCKEDHEHIWINKEFDSLEEAREYILGEELDTKFAVRSSVESGLVAKGRSKPEVPNQQWSCNRNNRSSTWIPKRKNSKKLLNEKCPAKFVVRPRDVADRRTIGKVNGKIQNATALDVKTKWIIYGCLTHSHDVENTKLLKLSHRVRKNIALLLKLDIPMYRVRSQYLKTEHFGGATGKIPDCENSRLIQRRCYPQPPDLTCPELEICFRYMALQFIRCFNFVRREDPLSHNPSTGQCNGKPITADDVIVIFMEEEQRRIFRESNGAIITSYVENVYKNRPGFNLLSLMVLNSQGEATPIIQAISANDFDSTAKILLDTLRQLEPSTTNRIHCLMTTEALEDPYIAALAKVLPQNSVLTTYPLRDSYVEPYQYVVRTSLNPFSGRLDELIYAVFKMNEALQQKRDRVKFGFYGNVKSSVQLDFEQTHPTYDKSQQIHFDMVKISNEEVDECAWEVSKYQANEFCDTNVVSIYPPSKMLCSQHRRARRCQVVCRSCMKEDYQQNGNLSTVSSCCGHALSCSCDEFYTRHSCEHFHIVSMFQDKLKLETEKVESELLVFKGITTHCEVKIICNRTTDNYSENTVIEGEEAEDVREKEIGQTVQESEGLNQIITKKADAPASDKKTENSSSILTTVENIVSTFSTPLDVPTEDELKLKPCSVKLERTDASENKHNTQNRSSTFATKTETRQFEYDELRNTAISRLSRLLSTLKKGKKYSAKNKAICKNVIKFIDSDCPDIGVEESNVKTHRILTNAASDESFSSAINEGFHKQYNQHNYMSKRTKRYFKTSENDDLEKLETTQGKVTKEESEQSAANGERTTSMKTYAETGDVCTLQRRSSCSPRVSSSGLTTKFADIHDQGQWDDEGKLLPYFVNGRESRWRHQIIGHNSPRYNLLREALNSDLSNFSWCMLVCGHMEKSLDILTNEFNFDEREIILEKFVMAKTLWTCKKCFANDHTEVAPPAPNIVELVLSGYIECRLCRHWFHRMCCAENIVNFDDVNFVCESCSAMFVIEQQVPTDPYTETSQPDGLVHHIKKIEGDVIVEEEGGEMVVDVTEVVDNEGNRQQIYFHQPMTSVPGATSQTYSVVQGSLENPQHIAAGSHVPSVGPTVQQITGFEMMY